MKQIVDTERSSKFNEYQPPRSMSTLDRGCVGPRSKATDIKTSDINISTVTIGAYGDQRSLLYVLKSHCPAETPGMVLSPRHKKSTGLTLKVVRLVSRKFIYLTTLTINHERICARDILTYLPRTLTHLSLSKCKISIDNLTCLLTQSTRFQKLKTLDLRGAACIDGKRCYTNRVCLDDTPSYCFPYSLLTLNLAQSDLPQDVIAEALVNTPRLRSLDLSQTQISLCTVMAMSRNLKNLLYLYMEGCCLSESSSSGRGDEIFDTYWKAIWRDGFHVLMRLNVRGVKLSCGHEPPTLRNIIVVNSLVDVNNHHHGDWTGPELATSPVPVSKSRQKKQKRNSSRAIRQSKLCYWWKSLTRRKMQREDEDGLLMTEGQ